MARIDHSFSVERPPDVAQAMFVRDIAPELARDRDFEIVRERPGQLVFSDGVAAGSDLESAEIEESTQEREDLGTVDAPVGGSPADPRLRNLNARFVADDLPSLLARHIHVEFTPEATGTRVRVHGHLERDVCHALELLGTPRHWPETADQPHD
jgi:hypothetical protein